MIIHREQVKTLDAAGQARFEVEMLAHLKAAYPHPLAGVEDGRVKELISRGLERARENGFQARGPVRMYIEFMTMLGHEFDRDPLLYWIRDILQDKEGLDEMTQASRLHLHVSTYLELVYGPGGEHVTKGLEHVAKAPLEELAAIGKAYESKAIPWLQALHSRKCVYAGATALTNLLREARQGAAQFRLAEPEGPPLLLGLMFAFGSGVMTDPLFPWIAASIDGGGKDEPRARVERLATRAQAYLRQALAERKG